MEAPCGLEACSGANPGPQGLGALGKQDSACTQGTIALQGKEKAPPRGAAFLA